MIDKFEKTTKLDPLSSLFKAGSILTEMALKEWKGQKRSRKTGGWGTCVHLSGTEGEWRRLKHTSKGVKKKITAILRESEGPKILGKHRDRSEEGKV